MDQLEEQSERPRARSQRPSLTAPDRICPVDPARQRSHCVRQGNHRAGSATSFRRPKVVKASEAASLPSATAASPASLLFALTAQQERHEPRPERQGGLADRSATRHATCIRSSSPPLPFHSRPHPALHQHQLHTPTQARRSLAHTALQHSPAAAVPARPDLPPSASAVVSVACNAKEVGDKLQTER